MLISIQDYEKTSTYKFIEDVIEIVAPLKKLGIVNFYYIELTEIEGSYYISGLVNNDQMMRAFLENNGLKYEPALFPQKILKPGFYSVSSMFKSKSIKNYYDKNFMFSGTRDEIIFIYDDKNVRKIYIFGLLGASYVNRSYLEMFIFYFNDKARPLINKSERLKIPSNFIESHYLPKLYNADSDSISWEIEQEFLNSINARYYRIKKLQQEYSLSQRELQCLDLMLQNKITKEIAYILKLEKNTIDSYIYNLKRKLNCRTKQELILKFFW